MIMHQWNLFILALKKEDEKMNKYIDLKMQRYQYLSILKVGITEKEFIAELVI